MNYDKVIDLVKKAGQLVFDKGLKSSVSMKGAADFVTATDLKISSFLKNELAILFPEIGFMSEEGDNDLKKQMWILDPIDGTTNLVYDYNMSSVSLAHYDGEKIVFGIVYNPYNEDTFIAYRNQGAYYNGKRLSPAPDRDFKDCLVEFGAGSTKKAFADVAFGIAKEVFLSCLDLRRICSSALAICYIAAGKLNGYFEYSLKPWDYAAATLMLEECGCTCSDWEGKPVQFEKPSSFICGTPKAYKALLDIVSKK